MNLAWQNFWKHPASSLKGALGFATVLLLAWGHTHPDAKWVATATGLCSAAISFFGKDVGREETNSGTMQDSHEIPNTGAPVAPKEAGQ